MPAVVRTPQMRVARRSSHVALARGECGRCEAIAPSVANDRRIASRVAGGPLALEGYPLPYGVLAQRNVAPVSTRSDGAYWLRCVGTRSDPSLLHELPRTSRPPLSLDTHSPCTAERRVHPSRGPTLAVLHPNRAVPTDRLRASHTPRERDSSLRHRRCLPRSHHCRPAARWIDAGVVCADQCAAGLCAPPLKAPVASHRASCGIRARRTFGRAVGTRVRAAHSRAASPVGASRARRFVHAGLRVL